MRDDYLDVVSVDVVAVRDAVVLRQDDACVVVCVGVQDTRVSERSFSQSFLSVLSGLTLIIPVVLQDFY